MLASINTKLKGYKTIIVGAAIGAFAVAKFAGVELPDPSGEEVAAVASALMILLRLITSGKVGEK